MSRTYDVPAATAERALIDNERFEAMYAQSINEPETFWRQQSDAFLSWSRPWETLNDVDMRAGNVRWFDGGELNVATNCIDRHLPERAQQTAIIWEGDDPADSKHITYQGAGAGGEQACQRPAVARCQEGRSRLHLHAHDSRAAYAMLACARIGAVHSVVFGGFSPQSLKDRILDSDCQTLITADEGVRGGKPIPLKQNAEVALADCPNVHTVVTVRRTGGDVPFTGPRDVWYHELVDSQPEACAPEPMASEDPLFILYTSAPPATKGVQHGTAGYLLIAAMTHKVRFDYQDATSTGVPPMSVGSPATATSSTGRWRTAPRR